MKMFDSIADELVRQKAKERAEKIKAEEKLEAERAEAEALEVHTVEPVIPLPKETRGRKPLPRIVCPYCEDERKQNGVQAHISVHHGVPGVSVKDIIDVQEGVKSLEALTCEKFDDNAEIELRNLSDEVSREAFGSWNDMESSPVESNPVEVEPIESKSAEKRQEEPPRRKRWYDRIRPLGFEDKE